MNEEKFSGKAENYDRYRASYPAELIDRLYSDSIKSVADIGAGTGKFTVLLKSKPWKITAVEPNPDMLSRLRENAPFADIVKASAENTGLPDGSVDLITVATAFHWFDETKFKAECQRILTENGRLAIIFNNQVSGDLTADCNELFCRLCGFTGHAGKRSVKDGDEFLTKHYFSDVELFTADNSLEMNREQFIGRNLSRSYAPRENEELCQRFISELNEIFDKHKQNGIVSENYITTCYYGKL